MCRAVFRTRRWYIVPAALLLLLALWLLYWRLFPAPPVEEVPFVEAPFDTAAFGVARSRAYVPATGTVEALLIFAQFNGENHPLPDYADRLFDPDWPGSFTHFYDTMSFGQLRVQGTVLPRRYTADRPASAYLADSADEDGRYGEFVQEILKKVDADVDLGQFDNNGPDGLPNSGDDDGRVDYVFVLLPSVPRNFLLGKADGRAGLGTKFRSATVRTPRGKAIYVGGIPYHGNIMRESSFSRTVGVMAHEFGHSLGLPDLYDVSFQRVPDQGPEEDSAGIGCWGLMGRGAYGCKPGDGPSPLCAWSRERLGWIGPDNERLVVVEPHVTDMQIADLHQSGLVYKIPLRPDEDLEEEEQEYLLLEYKNGTAHLYNQHLPAPGLLIWHIRPLAGDNTQEEHQLVELVCADGLYRDAGYDAGRVPDPFAGFDNLDFWARDSDYSRTHKGNLGDDTDVFGGSGYTHFGPYSNPSTRPFAPGLAIDITPGVAAVHATFTRVGREADLSIPTAVLETPEEEPAAIELLPNYPNPFSRQTTIPYLLTDYSEVRLRIFNALGQIARRLVEEPQAAGSREVVWDGRDEGGKQVASGMYLCRLEVGDRFSASRPMLRLAGSYSLSTLEEKLEVRGDGGAALAAALRPIASQNLGIAGAFSVSRSAFSAGWQWVRLPLLWSHSPDVRERRQQVESLVENLRFFAATAAQGEAVDRLVARLKPERSTVPEWNQIGGGIDQLVQGHSEEAAIFFYLGTWLQHLRASILAAQHLQIPLAEIVDFAAHAATSRQVRAYLEELRADTAFMAALQQMEVTLEGEPSGALASERLLEQLNQLAGTWGGR